MIGKSLSLFSLLESETTSAIVMQIGWLLFHSLWQFTVLALVAGLFSRLMQKRSASERYIVLSCTLLLMVFAPVVTWTCLPSQEKQIVDSLNVPQGEDHNALADSGSIAGQRGAIRNSNSPIPLNTPPQADALTGNDAKSNLNSAPNRVFMALLNDWWTTTAEQIRPWMPTIVATWCCGVLLFSIRPIWGWLTVRKLKHVGVSPVPDSVQQALHRIIDRMQFKRRVEVLVSTLVTSPVVVGCFRSVILLPANFISMIPISQLEAILAHELAHARRYDYVVNLLQTLVETIFFYHPAVWWLSHCMRLERENCCDDMVVAVLEDNIEYGRALLAVEEFRSRSIAALALSTQGGSLLQRVRRLIHGPGFSDRGGVSVSAFGVLATIILLGCFLSASVVGDAIANNDDSSTKEIQGIVTDEKGEPVSQATMRVLPYPTGKVLAESDNAGRFSFSIPADCDYWQLKVESPDRQLMFAESINLKRNGRKAVPGIDEPLMVKLSKIVESNLTVVDSRGDRVQDATVVVQNGLTEVDVLTTDAFGRAKIRLPQGSQPMIMSFKSGVGYDYFSADVRDSHNYPIKNPPTLSMDLLLNLSGAKTVRVRAIDSSGQPIAGAKFRPWYVKKEGNPGETNFGTEAFSRTTDANGLAFFDWIPADVRYGITFWPSLDGYEEGRLNIKWSEFDESKTYDAVFKRLSSISGRIVDASGKPVGKASVRAHGAGINRGDTDVECTTDASGRFSMKAAPDRVYVVIAHRDDFVGYVDSILIREGSPVKDLEVKLTKGTIVQGQVTRGTPPRPLPDQWVLLSLDVEPFSMAHDTENTSSNSFARMNLSEGTSTDSDGRFRFIVAPGKYDLSGPRQAKPHKLKITDEEQLQFDFNVPREEMMQFEGGLKGPDGKPLADVGIYGVYEGWTHSRQSFSGKTDDDGHFSIERETQPAMVQYLTADKSLGAIQSIDGDLNRTNVTLLPTYSARGRLLKPDGAPYANANIVGSVRVYQGEKGKGAWAPSFGSTTTTDEEGRYSLEHLVQDANYHISLNIGDDGRSTNITTLVAARPGTVELGEHRVEESNGPQTLKERIAAAFNNQTPLANRLSMAKQEAVRDYTRIAIIVASPDSQQAEWLYRLLRGSSDDRLGLSLEEGDIRALRSAMNDFRQIWIDSSQFGELRTLLPDHRLESNPSAALILLDTNGSWLAHFVPDLNKQANKRIAELQSMLEKKQLPDHDAFEVLRAAKEQAAREGKHIFLQETATWCGPCHRLSRFIEQHRAIFDKHFVWIKIDRERMTNGDELMKSMRPGNSLSVPWIAVLDHQGTVSGTSTTMTDELRSSLRIEQELEAAKKQHGLQHPVTLHLQNRLKTLTKDFDDDNFGFPTEAKEVERFLTMLTIAAPTAGEEIATLRAGLLSFP